ncbi:hypothetical protein [Streptomyces sp. NBC_01244]|nr:hypothetical protein OG247_22735 [Streptomyces sp. NBC_01244]
MRETVVGAPVRPRTGRCGRGRLGQVDFHGRIDPETGEIVDTNTWR